MYREEISTIDMIIENTTRYQLQEHTPAVYSQCHTPYVGTVMEAWPPGRTPDPCIPADTPCTGLDFQPDNCDVKRTLLCLSTSEVFVSLDDLEPSLDVCKSPEGSSLTANPAGFAQSYCTLTNTEMGLIPTFCRVQRVSSLDSELKGHTSPGLLDMQIEGNTPELDTVTLDNLQMFVED